MKNNEAKARKKAYEKGRGSFVIPCFSFGPDVDLDIRKQLVNADFKMQLIFQVAVQINSAKAVRLRKQVLGEVLFRTK